MSVGAHAVCPYRHQVPLPSQGRGTTGGLGPRSGVHGMRPYTLSFCYRERAGVRAYCYRERAGVRAYPHPLLFVQPDLPQIGLSPVHLHALHALVEHPVVRHEVSGADYGVLLDDP